MDAPIEKQDSRSSSAGDGLDAAVPALPNTEPARERPDMHYWPPSAFVTSFAARLRFVMTRRFLLSLLAGQVISLCITCTNVTTTELQNNRNWALPSTQSIFLYFTLFMVYTPYTIFKYGIKGWAKMIFKDGWKYFILAACDVEGNFMVVKAYQYTDLLSCMLLDAWAIPVCIFFSYLYFRTKYHWTQYFGVFVCVAGLGLLVAADVLTDKNWEPTARGKGDGLMVAGATLYGFTNATEELFVRKRPLYEVVGQLGMWGFMISSIQAAGLEHSKMWEATWDGPVIGLIIAYTAAMLILYTLAPLLYRMASSAYYNLSILTSDFWGLCIGLSVYNYHPYWLYFVAFVVVLLGLITYFWHDSPEEQTELNVQRPDYVRQDGRAQENAVAV
ncbi:DUF914-domain-containing protein [Cylindrobasidium torrendii FP15055 ss-10]|uniref:DUF914-domain-containing protein n=1 Tax=Cylindrobasidium torrendii FP15055 ss-10 TaxID=1314674 RepID=A0A0D7BV49_9AGAR|nr:DUF914-domain-containing protein [Cylindrobasidium torrendii FP15055 ss-10]